MQRGNYFQDVVGPIQNGWYPVIDRHAEATAGQNLAEVLQRSSFHMTAALYDRDTRALYVYETDTGEPIPSGGGNAGFSAAFVVLRPAANRTCKVKPTTV